MFPPNRNVGVNMGAHAAVNLPMSKFAFCDLALESAIQLEALKAGKNWNDKPVHSLAELLVQAARPEDKEAPASFIEASYYEPFERLTRQQLGVRQSVQDIKAYFGGAADKLRAVSVETGSAEGVAALVQFCVTLHRELARELRMEDLSGARQRRASDITP